MIAILEFIPIVCFFIAMRVSNIFTATFILMSLTVICVAVKYFFTKTASYFLIFSSSILVIMGSLTLIFKDAVFIKMKPTIVYFSCALALYIGSQRGKFFLSSIIMNTKMSNENWKILSKQASIFCLLLALLNEIIWRNFRENFWVNYKVFIMPIIIFIAVIYVKNFVEKKKIRQA